MFRNFLVKHKNFCQEIYKVDRRPAVFYFYTKVMDIQATIKDER